MMPQRKTPTHAYRRIAAALEEQITRGVYAPGDRLPAARELAEVHGVALGTAHAALRVLAQSGRVVATPQGTYVAEQPSVSAPAERLDAIRRGAGVLRAGESALITGVEREPDPPAHVITALDLQSGEWALRREYVLLDHAGRPVCSGVSWFAQSVVEQCPALEEPVVIPGGAVTAIAQGAGLLTADVDAVGVVRAPTQRERRELGLGEGYAGDVLEVRTWCVTAVGRVVEYNESAHPRGYVISLRRGD
jgi:GntR family transcriptional regulator